MQARNRTCYMNLGPHRPEHVFFFRHTHSILFPALLHDEAKEIIQTHGYLMRSVCSPQDTFAVQKACCQPYSAACWYFLSSI